MSQWGVIVTDVQGDFTEWKNGSLAVADSGEDYVRRVEGATLALKKAGLTTFGTQDWHSADHMSFAMNHPGTKPFDVITIDGRTQVLWPSHCVQGTENARVLVDNNLFLAIVRKAQNPAFDSYSAFKDDGGGRTEMDSILRRNGIDALVIYGIATDYCVKATALDAIAAGYRVIVVEELCRGISPETAAQAIGEMKGHGTTMTETLEDAMEQIAPDLTRGGR